MNLCTRVLFCLGLMFMTAQAASLPRNRTALVIGNARYEPSVGPLKNTTNDAKAIAKTLRELGFAVIEKHNVTRDQLLKAVLEFRSTLPGAEVGLFYFAGHGISVAGSNYLIPLKSDYTPEGADDTTLRLLAETRLFNVEQALADMRSAGAQCNLVILDACRTTAVAHAGRTRDVSNPGGLSEMKPPAGSLIAFATDAGQTALDGEGTNGLYTEELLKNVRTPGLTIEQVFKRTRAAVLQRSDGGQIPAEYSRLVGEDIYLAGPTTPAESTAPIMKAEPVPAPSQTEILNLAKGRLAEECTDALLAVAQTQGPGAYSAEPLTLLLDQVKEDLKEATVGGPKIEMAALTCGHVLGALPLCLPVDHRDYRLLNAKAHNRRGDALVLLNRAEEALTDYNTALSLTPEDSYILYNRGLAHAALGHLTEARADLQAATDLKFNQPKARKLAQEALAKLGSND